MHICEMPGFQIPDFAGVVGYLAQGESFMMAIDRLIPIRSQLSLRSNTQTTTMRSPSTPQISKTDISAAIAQKIYHIKNDFLNSRCYMSEVEIDDIREERIDMEIVVDAYNDEERAMGWYYYLEDNLNFPFKANWVRKGRKSSSTEGKEVEVVEMSSEDECLHDMFVEVLYKDATGEDTFSARLSDIKPIDADSETGEAIADWHYWVGRGYEF